MYDVIIIGAGPAGYVAGIRAGQLGMRTVLVDRHGVGGACLNWGCIPARSMLESARLFSRLGKAGEFGIAGIDPSLLKFSWPDAVRRAMDVKDRLIGQVRALLEKNGVEIIRGEAEISSPGIVSVENRSLETRHILIATGTKTSPMPWTVPEGNLLGVSSLFSMEEIPDKMTVFGAGPVAVEIAQLAALIGKKVRLLVSPPGLLPGFGKALESFVIAQLGQGGVDLEYTDEKTAPPQGPVVNCSFRRAVIPRMKVMCALDEGYIQVDRFFRTSIETIYAAGDVTGLSYLAHAASAQGMTAVNHMKGIKREHDRFLYPLTAYSVPEIAQIGMIEEELEDEGIDYRVSEFNFSANGKALIEGESDGFLRVLYEKKYGEVLGVQVAGAHATDIIAEAAVLIRSEGTVFDLASTVHAHPTVSEVFMEAGREASRSAGSD